MLIVSFFIMANRYFTCEIIRMIFMIGLFDKQLIRKVFRQIDLFIDMDQDKSNLSFID